MSLDLDRIIGLFKIVEQAAQHPAHLAPLGTLAMRELQDRARDAKIEHDKILADEAKELAAKKADTDAKAKKIADDEAKKSELTSKPQEVKRPEPVARPASEFEQREEAEAEAEASPVRRREVPEEATHG